LGEHVPRDDGDEEGVSDPTAFLLGNDGKAWAEAAGVDIDYVRRFLTRGKA
jgi:hypothetical protein